MFGRRSNSEILQEMLDENRALQKELKDREIEHRGYTEIVTQALVDAAAGSAGDGYVHALEIAAGALSRAFTAARVSGPGAAAFDPWIMAQIGRTLTECGEAVWYRSGAMIRRADNYDIRTDGTYSLNLNSGVMELNPRRVVHVRWNVDFDTQRGVGPLTQARQLRQIMQRLEMSMSDELQASVGYLLPIPDDGQSDTVENLRRQIAELKGRIAVIETARGGWGQGASAAPRREFDLQRLGPNIPVSSVQLFEAARNSVLSACGYPVDLVGGDEGTAQREAWRRYLHGTVAPLGKLVMQAAMRAGLEIDLDWQNLFASDIQGRARAFQSLVASGMSLESAAAASGILDTADGN